MWTAVIAASVLAFALKLLGYIVPTRWLEGPRTSRVTSALPIALLSALVAVQTLTGEGGALVVDARLAAVGVALAALTALLGAVWPAAHRDPPPPHHWADEASEHPGGSPAGDASPADAPRRGDAPRQGGAP